MDGTASLELCRGLAAGDLARWLEGTFQTDFGVALLVARGQGHPLLADVNAGLFEPNKLALALARHILVAPTGRSLATQRMFANDRTAAELLQQLGGHRWTDERSRCESTGLSELVWVVACEEKSLASVTGKVPLCAALLESCRERLFERAKPLVVATVARGVAAVKAGGTSRRLSLEPEDIVQDAMANFSKTYFGPHSSHHFACGARVSTVLCQIARCKIARAIPRPVPRPLSPAQKLGFHVDRVPRECADRLSSGQLKVLSRLWQCNPATEVAIQVGTQLPAVVRMRDRALKRLATCAEERGLNLRFVELEETRMEGNGPDDSVEGGEARETEIAEAAAMVEDGTLSLRDLNIPTRLEVAARLGVSLIELASDFETEDLVDWLPGRAASLRLFSEAANHVWRRVAAGTGQGELAGFELRVPCSLAATKLFGRVPVSWSLWPLDDLRNLQMLGASADSVTVDVVARTLTVDPTRLPPGEWVVAVFGGSEATGAIALRSEPEPAAMESSHELAAGGFCAQAWALAVAEPGWTTGQLSLWLRRFLFPRVVMLLSDAREALRPTTRAEVIQALAAMRTQTIDPACAALEAYLQ